MNGQVGAFRPRPPGKLLQQVCGAVRPGLVDHLIERFHPLGGLLWIQIHNPLVAFLVHGHLHYSEPGPIPTRAFVLLSITFFARRDELWGRFLPAADCESACRNRGESYVGQVFILRRIANPPHDSSRRAWRLRHPPANPIQCGHGQSGARARFLEDDPAGYGCRRRRVSGRRSGLPAHARVNDVPRHRAPHSGREPRIDRHVAGRRREFRHARFSRTLEAGTCRASTRPRARPNWPRLCGIRSRSARRNWPPNPLNSLRTSSPGSTARRSRASKWSRPSKSTN